MILRPATIDDCWNLANNLRTCDLQEIALGSGRTAQDAVREAWEPSCPRQAILTAEGKLAGIWGVVPIQPGLGSIWMLGTPELETIPLSFLRACRPAIQAAHVLHPTLACAAWRENALHLAWLRWLGFTANDVGHPHFIPHYRHV